MLNSKDLLILASKMMLGLFVALLALIGIAFVHSKLEERKIRDHYVQVEHNIETVKFNDENYNVCFLINENDVICNKYSKGSVSLKKSKNDQNFLVGKCLKLDDGTINYDFCSELVFNISERNIKNLLKTPDASETDTSSDGILFLK